MANNATILVGVALALAGCSSEKVTPVTQVYDASPVSCSFTTPAADAYPPCSIDFTCSDGRTYEVGCIDSERCTCSINGKVVVRECCVNEFCGLDAPTLFSAVNQGCIWNLVAIDGG